MSGCPHEHYCSLCGRHIAHGRFLFHLDGTPVCVRCVEDGDLYDDLDLGVNRAGAQRSCRADGGERVPSPSRPDPPAPTGRPRSTSAMPVPGRPTHFDRHHEGTNR